MADIEALGNLNIGIARILHKYPLLGGLIASWSKREDHEIETMAIGMSADRIELYYAPGFIKKISVEGIVAVLHHEVRHVIHGHVFINPENYSDSDALVIAEEVTVNERLPEKLPIRGILLKDYPKLKPDEDTLTRYKILAKHSSKQKPESNSKSGSGGSSIAASTSTTSGSGSGAMMIPPSSPATAAQPPTGGQPSAGTGSTAQQGTSRAPNHSGKVLKGKQIDSHERWKDIKAQESYVKATIAATLEELIRKGAKPTDYEKTIIVEGLKAQGFEPGAGLTELEQNQQQTLRWQTLLRRYVGRELERVASYIRPSRRFPDLVGIMPGHYSACARPRIMASIDTSGSMSDSDLAEISNELRVMAAKFEVHVVECDCIIHQHYKYKGPIKTVLGRGGTSFLPPLEPAFLKTIKPDLIIFFTDGFGDAPEHPPNIPVVWVLTAGGQCPVKWGRVLHMDKDGTE